MSSKRIAQVNELLREELGKMFTRELELPEGCIATISRVETSTDLEHARVWLKIFPTDRSKDVLSIILRASKELQHQLSQKLVMRQVPRLKYKIDESEGKAARIEQLIDQIHHDDT